MSLYFLAILPPEKLQHEIHEIKEAASEEFESVKSLNAPPHLTIIPPFSMSDEGVLLEFFNAMKLATKSFEVKLLNFGNFGKRTIYLAVESSPNLHLLQEKIEMLFNELAGVKRAKNNLHVFTPHVTILNRDITEENFDKAWEKFRKTSFQARFSVSELILFKHEGKKWKELLTIPLS